MQRGTDTPIEAYGITASYPEPNRAQIRELGRRVLPRRERLIFFGTWRRRVPKTWNGISVR